MSILGTDSLGEQMPRKKREREPLREMVLEIRKNTDKLARAEKAITQGLFAGKEPESEENVSAPEDTLSIADHLTYISNSLSFITGRLSEIAKKL